MSNKITEHHKFTIMNKYFLFIPDEMKAYRINKTLYDDITYNSVDHEDKGLLKYSDSLFRLSENKIYEKLEKQGYGNADGIYSVSLNVAQICNMNCLYCYGSGGEYGKKIVMEKETAERCIDYLIKSSGNKQNIFIGFFGGEPLLNYPLIREIVDYAKKSQLKSNKRFFFSITTNGTLLNDRINKFLENNNISVTISFDGDKQSQDVNRPLNIPISSFDFIAPRIHHYLFTRNDKAIARVTLTGLSAKLKVIKSSLNKIGFKRMEFIPASVDLLSDLGITKEQLYEIISDIKSEAEELLKKIRSKQKMYSNSFTDIVMRVITRQRKFYYCGAGRTYAAIGADGNLYPCHRLVGDRSMCIGNINGQSAVIDNKLNIDSVDRNVYCNECWAKYICGGGCYYDNYQRNRDYRKPNLMNCVIFKRKAEYAVYLINELSKDEREYLIYKLKKKNM